MSPSRPLRIAVVACLLMGVDCAAALAPEERAALRAELREPLVLRLRNGRSLRGHAIEVTGAGLRLATVEDAGEAVFTFHTDAIDSIEAPGEHHKARALAWMEAGRNEDALELMDLLYRRRKTLIPLLPPSEAHFFIPYVELILASPEPARAIAVAERIRPHVGNDKAARALDALILESHYRFRLFERAGPLAEAWVAERGPYAPSALAYFLLGMERFRAGDHGEALDLALRPVVFASPKPPERLNHCYALAVAAALALRDHDHAARLHREMLERALPWPEDDPELRPALDAIRKHPDPHAPDTD